MIVKILYCDALFLFQSTLREYNARIRYKSRNLTAKLAGLAKGDIALENWVVTCYLVESAFL